MFYLENKLIARTPFFNDVDMLGVCDPHINTHIYSIVPMKDNLLFIWPVR